MVHFWSRLKGRYQRTFAAKFARRPLVMANSRAIISFTFDDFPTTALTIGGKILEEYGARGTYYTSFGLMGQLAPTGEIFSVGDVSRLLAAGHELGCHTFDHLHAADTPAKQFERSVLANQQALARVAPHAKFESLSYPISVPRVANKRVVSKYYRASRAGGQTFNQGVIDLDHLSAFFLEQSSRDIAAVKASIDATLHAKGWMIFATHAVCEKPTRFGVIPSFFEEIVAYSIKSGAQICPVSRALTLVGA